MDFTDVIRRSSDYLEADYLRGRVELKLMDYADAVEDLNEAVRLNP